MKTLFHSTFRLRH